MATPRFWFLGGVQNPLRHGEIGNPDRRPFVYATIDSQGFQKWVVFIAGIGFLTDAYDIFALNVVIPMLGYVYWDGQIPHSYNTALVCSSLAGTLIGQAVFGILGDIFGRRKMYGLELVVVMAATLGVAMSSSGAQGSMQIIGWLIFWRFMMGVAIGADYPLSAVITAEFAPRKYRASMLAVVFWMQPWGQLLAILVSLVAVEVSKPWLPQNFGRCSLADDPDSCIRAIDQMWRWVVGIGAMPAILAVSFRFTIPESPRFMMDVLGETETAVMETAEYHGRRQNISTMEMLEQIGVIARDNDSIDEGPRQEPENTPLTPRTLFEGSRVDRRDELYTTQTSFGPPQIEPNANSTSIFPTTIATPQRDTQPSVQALPQKNALDQPPQRSWADAKNFFITEGNWRHLVGTSLSWFLLDFAFYGLGLSSSSIVNNIWYTDAEELPATVYSYLLDNVTHELVVVSIGSMIGGAIFIRAIHYLSPRTYQKHGFIILGLLFVITGASFKEIVGPGVVVLYVLCELTFNIGPNPTTFMIPAEIFPTRYRCSCHGISAACGKLGSVIVQLFLAYAQFDGKTYVKAPRTLLWPILLVLSAFMFAGFVVTVWLVPETRDRSGKSRSLEVLGMGRKRLQLLNGRTAEEDGGGVGDNN